MGDIGRCELIYGELIMMSPAGFGHGGIAARICTLLSIFVDEHALGEVQTAEAGFLVEKNPDLVRAPDVSFVRKERAPKTYLREYFPGVPDLAVEVISPNDTKREVAEKVNMWLAHGTLSCWVADPESMTITIHRPGQKPARLTIKDKITSESALPGFILPVSKIFKRPQSQT